MGLLIELVFAVGFVGLCGIALVSLIRYLFLRWIVEILGGAVLGALRLVKDIVHALVFVFAPAIVGAFIIGLALQLILNAMSGNGSSSADPTTPALVAFLAFFVIIAVRGWQLKRRRDPSMVVAPPDEQEAGDAAEAADLPVYPAGYETIAEAWKRAIELAPRHRADLLDAAGVCAALLAAVEQQDGIPDSAMTETAVLIRNHLAALVDSTKRRLLGAKPRERTAIIDEMVKFLRGFAKRAHEDMQATSFGADEEDSTLRAHLASQLFR